MRSRLFKAVFEDPESSSAKTFTRHLNELLSLDKEMLSKCIEALPKLLRPRTEFQTRQMIDGIVDSREVDRQLIEHSLAVLKFFIDALLSDDVPKDDHQGWAGDLVDLGVIAGTNRSVFQAVIDALANKRMELRTQDRQESATSGVIPRFKRAGITVEARAIINERYHWGTPIDEYRPDVIGITYVASAHIGVDEGFPEDFYFQLDETDIEDLIASLTAARKEILALREYLKLGSGKGGV